MCGMPTLYTVLTHTVLYGGATTCHVISVSAGVTYDDSQLTVQSSKQ